jgi:hypothetical protein
MQVISRIGHPVDLHAFGFAGLSHEFFVLSALSQE